MVPVKLLSSAKEGGRGYRPAWGISCSQFFCEAGGVGLLHPLPFGNLRLEMTGRPQGDFSLNFQIL